MTELGPDDPERQKLASDMLELYLVYRVEMGLVEIGNRASEEILADLLRDAREALDKGDFDFPIIWDYRDLLLDQASSAASEGALELSIVLYATWIEHCVNRILLVTLERQGLSPKSGRVLIRDLRLPTKVTALWELVHLPALSPAHLQLIDKIASLRNSFVHYKWPRVVDEYEERQRREFDESVSRIESLVQMFHEVENQTSWFGRRDEIIQALREDGG